MQFANDYGFRKYMERKNGLPRSEKLYRILTKPGTKIFSAYSREPFMSETLVSMFFDHHILHNKFKKVLIRLRGAHNP